VHGWHCLLHLENVFTELHAVTIRDGLSFPNYYLTWSDGQPQDGQAEVSAKSMLEQLAWWAAVLRAARVAVPYPSGA
jgi:NAD(P)H-dependent FMN reductase